MSRPQTLGEEVANSISHGIGAALSIVALVLLVMFASLRGNAWQIVSFSVYGSTLFLLYISSTLYHGFTNARVKYFFRTMDHTAIYLLIAGTYTPITLVSMQGFWRWATFGLIWGLAVIGIIVRFLPSRKGKGSSTLFYVAMGWVVVVAIKPMLQMLPTGLLVWMCVGGAFYTFGVIFYLWERLPYHHAVWHLFVLGGSISHFFGMLFYLV